MIPPEKLRFQIQGWPLALVLFLPTVYPATDVMWMPVLVLWIAQQPKLKLYSADLLAVFFVLGVCVQTMAALGLHYIDERPWSPNPLAYVLILACLFIGRSLQPATIRWLLILFCLEAAVCTIQLILRVPYVFPGQRESILNTGVTEWGTSDLLYFNRMYGLSTNSSVAAQKFMLGMLLLFDAALTRRERLFAGSLFAIGLFATFNRTAMLVVACFLGLQAMKAVWRTTGGRRRQVILMGGVAVAALVVNWPAIENQFMRGNLDRSLVEESGRSTLWMSGTAAIAAHPLVGNLSQRFLVYDYGELIHLHNSWLQLAAEHGFIGWLLILHTFTLINRRNCFYFISLGLYSFVQFGLFGKISLLNIVYFYFMRRILPVAPQPVSASVSGRTSQLRSAPQPEVT